MERQEKMECLFCNVKLTVVHINTMGMQRNRNRDEEGMEKLIEYVKKRNLKEEKSMKLKSTSKIF
jgi:hypothetical protein